MTAVETIVLTAAGSVLAALAGRVLWDRWRAPEHHARRAEDRYVPRVECARCEAGASRRLDEIGHRLDRIEEANADEHGRLFGKLDDVLLKLVALNGKAPGR